MFLVAMFVTPQDLGQIRTGLAYVEILSVVSLLGMNTSILYHCNSKVDKVQLRGYLTTSLVISLLFSMLILLSLGAFFYSEIQEANEYFLYFLLSLPTLVLAGVSLAFLQATQKFKEFFYSTVPPKLIATFILVVCTYFFSKLGYVYGYLIGSIITGVYPCYYLGQYIRFNFISIDKLTNLLKVGKYSMISNLIGALGVYLGLIILSGSSASKFDVGQISFALIILVGFDTITATVQQHAIPKLNLVKLNRDEWYSTLISIEKKFVKYAWLLGFLTSFLSLLVYNVFDGFKYSSALLYFSALSVIWPIASGYTVKGAALISVGRTNLNFKFSLFSFIFMVPLTYLLVNEYEIIGLISSRFFISLYSRVVMTKIFNSYIRDVDAAQNR
ncbi:oligosaccharide flippase family protein [Vibrio clamense]